MIVEASVIDDNGYVLEIITVDDEETVDGSTIKTKKPNGLYRARWDGKEWVEDMPQKEIDKLNNQPKELTENEITMMAIVELSEIVLGGM